MMGLLTANQVTRKLLVGEGVAAATAGTYGSSIGPQIADYVVLAATLDNQDSIDHFFEFALFSPNGNSGSLGTVTVTAPASPSDQSVVNLGDPAGDLNLVGLVVPAGWDLKFRAQPAFVGTGSNFALQIGMI